MTDPVYSYQYQSKEEFKGKKVAELYFSQLSDDIIPTNFEDFSDIEDDCTSNQGIREILNSASQTNTNPKSNENNMTTKNFI